MYDMKTKDTWREKRVELLKALHSEGLTAAEIANEIGGVTRMAVIGKIHRLGLSRKPASEIEATGD